MHNETHQSVDIYSLTGKLSLASEGTDSNPHEKICLLVGERVFEATRSMYDLLRSVQEPADLPTICRRFTELGGQPLTEAKAAKILSDQLIPQGLARIGTETKSKGKASFLLFRRELMREATVNRIARHLVGFLSPLAVSGVAAYNGILIGLWLRAYLSGATPGLFSASWSESPAHEFLLGMLALLGCVLLHEFGHAAACIRNNIRPSGIGLGLHLIFPVLYCDVSRSWALPQKGRLEVGFGGCAMQLWGCAVFGTLALVTDHQIYFAIWAANIVSILVTLNPWLRFDGYWIFSDYFDIKNLSTQASEYRINCWRQVLSPSQALPSSNSSRLLKAYAWSAHLVMILLAGLVLGSLWRALPGLLRESEPALRLLLEAPTPKLIFQILWTAIWFGIYAVGLFTTLVLLGREPYIALTRPAFTPVVEAR